MRKQREDVSRFVLLALVVAVLVVSLLGTWLVLDTGFSASAGTQQGQVSFTKEYGTASPQVAKSNPVAGGVIAFAKQK